MSDLSEKKDPLDPSAFTVNGVYLERIVKQIVHKTEQNMENQI